MYKLTFVFLLLPVVLIGCVDDPVHEFEGGFGSEETAGVSEKVKKDAGFVYWWRENEDEIKEEAGPYFEAIDGFSSTLGVDRAKALEYAEIIETEYQKAWGLFLTVDHQVADLWTDAIDNTMHVAQTYIGEFDEGDLMEDISVQLDLVEAMQPVQDAGVLMESLGIINRMEEE